MTKKELKPKLNKFKLDSIIKDIERKTPKQKAPATNNFLFENLFIFNLLKTKHHCAIADSNPYRRKHKFDC